MAFERRTRDGLAVACLAVVALSAAGGAAATPDGLLLGSPSWAGLCLAAAGALLAWRLAPGRRGMALGLLPFVVSLPLAPWIPGLAAWTGPPLLAALFGVLLLLGWDRLQGATARRLLFPGLLAVYCVAAWRVQQQVGPEGDEPHYLMVAESLLRDRDLSLEQDYAERRYEAFYRKGTLLPHYRVRGARGEIYSLHAVGLSLLLVPAWGLGGYPAASFFMAALAALLVRELRALSEAWLGEPGPPGAVAWLVGLSPPLLHYAGLIFSEVPAALLLCLSLRLAHEPLRLRGRRLVTLCAALGFLPWLNVRYALLSGLVLLYAIVKRPHARALVGLVGGALATAFALAAYHRSLYGFFDPRRVYGTRPELALAQLPEGLPGLLLDQEFGLLVYAPILVLAIPGLLRLSRARPREGVTALLLVVSAALLAGSWHMWRGGWNPPARFLVPVVPVLAAGGVFALRSGLPAAAALLAGFGLWTGLLGAAQPRLVHRDRDGTAPLFRAHSGALEWTRLLPRYVLGEPDRHALAAVWTGALLAAALAARRARPASPAGVALTGVAALAFAGMASALSRSASGGRDAVRLLGLPALELPSGPIHEAAPARWTAASLGWGPTFEPHRHPEGALVGDRLDLPAGTYRFVLQAEVLGAAPDLLVIREEEPRDRVLKPLQAGNSGWEAALELERRAVVTLRLRGGSALIVNELRLEPSTFRRPLGLIR